jgi:Uma2 family endonuclease
VKKARRSTRPIKKTPPAAQAEGLPVLYEDEEEEGLGEAELATIWTFTLFFCFQYHLANRPELRIFSNLSLIYLDAPLHPITEVRPYVSPDIMIVQPFTPLTGDVKSYTIGTEGPVPLLTVEVLSDRSVQQRDLSDKLDLYAALGVKEYILADPMSLFLPQHLLLLRLQRDRTWKYERDADDGVTSQLVFRIIAECPQLRLIETATGKRYIRPQEMLQPPFCYLLDGESLGSQTAEDIRREARLRRKVEEKTRAAEEKCRALEAEIQRLREASLVGKKPKRRPQS